MRSVNFFFCVACLVFAAQNVFAAENDIDDDEWISISKDDLCPALQKEVFCTESFDFDEVAKKIDDLRKEDVDDDQVDAGKDASNCGDPLRKALCSKDASPLCLKDKTSGDDSAERRVCKELYDTCPTTSGKESLNYTEECVDYLKRKYSDLTCEVVGADDFKEDELGCPSPARRMPVLYIEVYKTQSKLYKPLADLLDGANDLLDTVWDSDCLKTVRELPCMPIYCTDDDATVEIKNKRKDCSRAMECVSKATEKLKSLTGDLAEGIVRRIRDEVKNSCETIIDGFDDIVNANSENANSENAKGTGVSTAEYSISFTLLAAFFCLKMFW